MKRLSALAIFSVLLAVSHAGLAGLLVSPLAEEAARPLDPDLAGQRAWSHSLAGVNLLLAALLLGYLLSIVLGSRYFVLASYLAGGGTLAFAATALASAVRSVVTTDEPDRGMLVAALAAAGVWGGFTVLVMLTAEAKAQPSSRPLRKV